MEIAALKDENDSGWDELVSALKDGEKAKPRQSIDLEPGIYFGLDDETYYSAKGLSCSGMKQLAVSPLNYWHNNLNPDREPQEESFPQRLGKAVHCRLLEPANYGLRYAVGVSRDDYPDALDTIDDMKGWLADRGLPSSAKRKQDLIDRIKQSGHAVEIWEEIRREHAQRSEGKVLLQAGEAAHIERLANQALSDPWIAAALTGGMPEVSFVVRDPETGVLLKARMDYVRPDSTIDLKTFSNSRGKAVDRVVHDAIYYEKYHLQFVTYRTIRELARKQLAAGVISTFGEVPESWLKAFVEVENHGFEFIFIESSAPFETRAVVMRQAEVRGADPNVYWMDADLRLAELKTLYAEYQLKYGDDPWREPCSPRVLEDADIPQMLFSGRT